MHRVTLARMKASFRRDASGGVVIQDVALRELVATHRTPLYVYDVDAMVDEALDLKAGFGSRSHLVAYAVKANSAGPIIRRFAAAGLGADVVSGAELQLSVDAGIAPNKILYSGVAKLAHEIDLAIAVEGKGILALQAESVEELPRIAERAKTLGKRARVTLRLNPDIEADTHAHIATGHDEAKFGIPVEDLGDALALVLDSEWLELSGIGNHIGSQLTSLESYCEAARRMLVLFRETNQTALARGQAELSLIDFGGGFGIDYGSGCPVTPRDFARELVGLCSQNLPGRVLAVVEPGRSLVAAHGAIVSSVVMQKSTRHREPVRRWLMIDAGMNDLMRPALYGAFHRIVPLVESGGEALPVRVVGPVCESSDDFGEHCLPLNAEHVLIRDAGAYGFTMASEYNGRPLPTEIFLEQSGVSHVRKANPVSAWIEERLMNRQPT
jgi:diaminopimelate decarboxylase